MPLTFLARNCSLWGTKVAASLIILGLVGCAALPDSGPSRRSIEANASALLPGAAPVFNYVLVDLNSNILPYIVAPGPGSLYRTFGAGRGPAPEIRVGVGDSIAISVFESQAGGLFIPQEAGARSGNFVQIPNQLVDKRGYITVPYAGQIYALGRSTPEIQNEIINKLKNRAIEPQVVVTLANQTSTEVSVVGQVKTPNKFPINPAGDRILDVIARAGGITDQGYEDYVTLQRHGHKSKVYFLNLINDPRENIFVAPGDEVYVSFYQRSFMAFGATNAEQAGTFTSAQVKFNQEELNLAEAVGKAGGLIDNRADPREVFIYRLEARSTLRKMGLDVSRFDEAATVIPTIYRVNFRDPAGYFAARRFPMRDGDVLYVDNADEVEITKFLTLLTTVTGSAATVATDVVTIKQSANALGIR